MAKKRKSRESTNNKNKKQNSQNCNSNKSKNNTNNESRKLSDFTYAEIIILSATLSYSLAEEFDEDDLAIFLVFLGVLLADIQVVVTQKAIKAKSQLNTNEDIDLAEENVNIDLGE